MSKHVRHLLAAYLEGQLTPHCAERVRQHIYSCPACYKKLARLEHVAADLQLVLGRNPVPRASQMEQWWMAIKSMPFLPAPRRVTSNILLPVVLSLLLLFLPLAAGVNGMAVGAAPTLRGTSAMPGVDVLAQPLPRTQAGVATDHSAITKTHPATVSATPIPVSSMPAVPIPPAPAVP